jgi:photosystem II stability/assembly factor-like uncharacterized protein
MKNKFIYLILSLIFLGLTPTYAQQKWMELREKGANFNDIKAAFLEENKSALKSYYQNLGNNNLAPNTEGSQAEHEREEYQYLIHYFRWAECIEPRVSETNGDIGAYLDADYAARLAQKQELKVQSGASWTVVGPINTDNMFGNGRVNSIKVDPNNASIYYAGTPAGQLWKSINAGASWSVISDAIPAAGVTDIAIDPTNSNILYALTGDADRAIYHPNSLGLYKSTNGGASWAASGLIYTPGQGILLTSILIHPTTPSVILVGGTNGIWRSTNSGASFAQVNSTAVRELVFNPIDPSIVFAGSKSNAVLLRSTDAGATWAQITSGLPTSTTAKRFSVDVSKADPNVVYLLATSSTDNMEGFYRSTDGGLTFGQMSTTPNITNGQGWYNLAVAADPASATTVYAAGYSVYKSTNSGATWTTIGIPHVDVHDLAFSGTDLLASSDGGVYRRNSAGTWANISNNLAISQPYGLGLSPSNPSMVVTGHQDNGSNLTTNSTTWRQISGGDGMISFIDRTNSNNIFFTYQNGVLRRSTDGGASSSTLYSVPNGYWVTPYMQDPVVSTTLYAGGYEIYKSADLGVTWGAISAFGTAAAKQFRWIDVCRTNNQIIYAITATEIFKTIDGGANWTNVSGTVPTTTHLHVHIDVNNPNNVYVSLASVGGNSVYYSTNGGTTWTNISAGLPNIPVNTVVTQIGSAGLAYCGTDLGVYYRNPSLSTSWQSFNVGLPSVPVRDLEIQYATSKIFAATFGRAVWVSPLDQPVIPVELITFKGAAYTEGSLLTWQTAQEIRFHHFDIERSSDTKAWQPLKQVAAKGSANSYQVVDEKPFTGINYYRLKMVDNDGSFRYSETVAVEWGKAVSTKWALFPNPVKDKLFLSGNENAAGEGMVQIVDISGKVMLQTTVQQARNGLTINQLASGTYFLEVLSSAMKERLSFVVIE